jgi:hypothetical protein
VYSFTDLYLVVNKLHILLKLLQFIKVTTIWFVLNNDYASGGIIREYFVSLEKYYIVM